MKSDRDFLAEKLRLADFGVTQFFFEADEYLGLMDDLAARGVDKPVLPGIMPVTRCSSVPRMAAMGAAVPDWAVARAGGGRRPWRATRRCAAGRGHGHRAVPELLDAGAPGLHFYTLNRSSATREIYAALGLRPNV